MERDASKFGRFLHVSGVPDPGDFSFGLGSGEPEFRIDDLGAGWEEVERALAAVQADFTRTIEDAPNLILLWYDRDDGSRRAYLGKSRDWYYGAEGGFEPSRSYVESVLDLIYELQGAVNDGLLGDRWAWPLCPADGYDLTVTVDADQTCLWFCDRGAHVLADVGRLGDA